MGYQNEIDFSKRSILKAGTVWGLAAVFYLYELMLLVSPSVMVDKIYLTYIENTDRDASPRFDNVQTHPAMKDKTHGQ